MLLLLVSSDLLHLLLDYLSVSLRLLSRLLLRIGLVQRLRQRHQLLLIHLDSTIVPKLLLSQLPSKLIQVKRVVKLLTQLVVSLEVS